MTKEELKKLGEDNGIQQIWSEWEEVLDLVNENDIVIEIGSYAGGSTFTLAEIAKEVICIDPINRWNPNEYKNITKFVGNSDDVIDQVKEYLGRKKSSVLVIDGDHSEEGVLKDYKLYSPLVKKNGAIVFHDIVDSEDHRRQKCFVANAWNKIKDETAIEIIDDKNQNWAGIGIIFKK